MSGPRYYLLDANHEVVPCELMSWAQWMEGPVERRRVGEDFVGDVRVSTVFLGLDHNWTEIGPPILFETMVFGADGPGYMERCSTWDEAQAMHRRVLYRVQELAETKKKEAP